MIKKLPLFLEKLDVTVFDTETTGLDPDSGDRIIEIAAVRIKNGVRAGTFHSLVNPGRPVSPGAFQVNGISDEMLEGAPAMKEIIPGFVEFIRGSCLCAYNSPFDMGFLDAEFRRAGKRFPRDTVVVDILAMARGLLRLERHALWYVARSLGVESEQEHRALSDVELTLEVFSLLLEAARSKKIATFDEFVGLFGRQCRAVEAMNNEKLSRLRKAIEKGAAVKIRYFSRSEGAISERRVIPRGMKTGSRNAGELLNAYCCVNNKERIFRLDGILALRQIPQRTVAP